MQANGFKQVVRAKHVDLEIHSRVANRGHHGHFSSEMKNGVWLEFLDYACNIVLVANVTVLESKLAQKLEPC
jgi:hypothetical protein